MAILSTSFLFTHRFLYTHVLPSAPGNSDLFDVQTHLPESHSHEGICYCYGRSNPGQPSKRTRNEHLQFRHVEEGQTCETSGMFQHIMRKNSKMLAIQHPSEIMVATSRVFKQMANGQFVLNVKEICIHPLRVIQANY